MRQRFPIFLLALLLTLDATAFILQKVASDHAAGNNATYLQTIVTHVWAWAAIALAPLQLWTWTRILGRVDISIAYPLTSLSVPLTMAASAVIFYEHPRWQVWLGALLITAGAAILKPANTHDGRRIQQ